jgi:DHA1 family multidrug resistance protein-like MFS transporter
MVGFWLELAGWRWIAYAFSIANFINVLAVMLLMQETFAPYVTDPSRLPPFKLTRMLIMGYYSAIKRKLQMKEEAKQNATNSVSKKTSFLSRFTMSADVRAVFGRAFSRPPRLLFGNPVCALFSFYFGEQAVVDLFSGGVSD